jgi:hypothetical protein
MVMKKPNELSPQCLEIYLLLKERLRHGVTPEMITDRDQLNIKEYTGRITDLRKAGYDVQNIKRNLYGLVSEPEMNTLDIMFILSEARLRNYASLIKRCELRLVSLELTKNVKEALS